MLQILLSMTFYTKLPLLKVAANLLILTISCAEPNASAEDTKNDETEAKEDENESEKTGSKDSLAESDTKTAKTPRSAKPKLAKVRKSHAILYII